MTTPIMPAEVVAILGDEEKRLLVDASRDPDGNPYRRLPPDYDRAAVDRLRGLKLVEWDGGEWGFYLTGDGFDVADLIKAMNR